MYIYAYISYHPPLGRGGKQTFEHNTNTTCITRAFFKSGEYCSKVNQPY